MSNRFFGFFTLFFFIFFKNYFFRDYWGVDTALSKIMRIFCKRLRRKRLSKLPTLSYFFQLPHSAMYTYFPQYNKSKSKLKIRISKFRFTQIPTRSKLYHPKSFLSQVFWLSIISCVTFNVTFFVCYKLSKSEPCWRVFQLISASSLIPGDIRSAKDLNPLPLSNTHRHFTLKARQTF